LRPIERGAIAAEVRTSGDARCGSDSAVSSTTATIVARLDRDAARSKLDELCMHNAQALVRAIDVCAGLGIRAFRVQSGMWPLYTHPVVGYRIDELPNGAAMLATMREAGSRARAHGIRLSFHPDQFTLLSSPRPEVLEASIRDLEYMAEMAELVGADVINIHGGGGYGDKTAALERVRHNIAALSDRVRSRLTLENDDVTYSPAELLPVCLDTGVPFAYDVHHHRCLPDGHGVEEVTELALATWNREPHFHVSSPRDRTPGANPRPHADMVEPADFPTHWVDLPITVDVEAKSKEQAVLALGAALGTGIYREGKFPVDIAGARA
jgi:UV DNA damage endonuclease